MDLSAPDVPAQPYHAASGTSSLEEAAALIRRAEAIAEQGALSGIDAVAGQHRDVRLVAAGIPESAASVPADLARLLSAHTLLHTAEGELFREAIASAASARRLRVHRLPARDVLSYAARSLDVPGRRPQPYRAEPRQGTRSAVAEGREGRDDLRVGGTDVIALSRRYQLTGSGRPSA